MNISSFHQLDTGALGRCNARQIETWGQMSGKARYFVFFNLQCNLACADSRSHVWRLPGRRAAGSGAGGAHYNYTQQSSVCVLCVLVVNSTGNLAPFPSILAFLLRRLLASVSESHAPEVVKS